MLCYNARMPYLCSMTTYHQLKGLDPAHLELLKRLGYLKQTFQRNVAIFERYLAYRESGEPKTDAVVHTADDFHISDRHVFTIIRAFSEDESVA